MRILLAEDEKSIAVTLGDELKKVGYQVTWAPDGQRACHAVDLQPFDVVITDIRMPKADGLTVLDYVRSKLPEAQVIIITAFGNVEAAVDAVKRGAYDYIEKPFLNAALVERIKKLEVMLNLTRENRRLREQVDGTPSIVGHSRRLQEVLDRVRAVARSDASVLIEGANGTGKERVAEEIHRQSPRAERALVKMSCSAFPESLIEDELFGHVRGAFTDARADKPGRFEQADGGTIFVDDIDDMQPTVQVKLLRVLQERQIERLGDTKTRDIDVRLIAATKKDLWKLCQEGVFREDLYFRLNVVKIVLPGLADRADDIPVLVQHFIKKHGRGVDYRIKPETLMALQGYAWPGNVRELENAVQRAIALSGDDHELTKENLMAPVPMAGSTVAPTGALASLEDVIAEAEVGAIQRTLAHTGGNRKQASEILGVSPKWLWERMRRYNIEG